MTGVQTCALPIYKIIRRLNDELVAAGYIIVSGRISRSYFEKKIYGGIA